MESKVVLSPAMRELLRLLREAETMSEAEFNGEFWRRLLNLHSEIDVSGSHPSLDGLGAMGAGPVAQLQSKVASLYAAPAAAIVTNGSSITNVALHGDVLPRLLPDGRRHVLLDRGSHASVIGGVGRSGLTTVWLSRRWNPAHDCQSPITAAQVEAEIAKNPLIGAVSLPSPTYDGFEAEIEEIASVCKKNDVLLIIDAAWAPQFGLMSDIGFPRNAISRGADAVTVSLHKKLGFPSQIGAVLFQDPQTAKLFAMAGRSGLATTSPAYVYLGLTESLVYDLAEGRLNDAWAAALAAANSLRARIEEACPSLRVISPKDVGATSGDATHVLISTGDAGVSGYDLLRAMGEQGFDCEKATAKTLLLLIGPREANHIDEIIAALGSSVAQCQLLKKDSDHEKRFWTLRAPATYPEAAISISEARVAAVEEVQLTAAAGRIAADAIMAYPPGAPIIQPGETIRDEDIAYVNAVLAAGGRIRGLSQQSALFVVTDDYGHNRRVSK